MLAPIAAAETLGVRPTTAEGHAITVKTMQFLGIRDIAVAAALFWLYHEREERAMGAIVTACTLVCVTDTWIAAHGPKGWDRGILGLCGGTVAVAVVGIGLIQSGRRALRCAPLRRSDG